MNLGAMARRVGQSIQHAAEKGPTHLIGNEAINPIGRSMLSPIAAAGEMWRTKSVMKPLKDTYMRVAKRDAAGAIMKDQAGNIILEEGINIGNIAGTYVAGSATLGVLGGLTHDTAGNIDIAGIPMI